MTEENMNHQKPTPASQEKIIYILDTNILLHEPFAFLSFKEHAVVVPMNKYLKTGITAKKILIFVQTSVKIKPITQFLQRNIITPLSFTYKMSSSSKLSLGEGYV